MRLRKKALMLIGGSLLLIGIIAGFVISGLIVWGDLEATLFTDGMDGDRRLSGLACPVLITENETGTISVTLKNPTNKDSDRYLRATISEGYAILVRETKSKIDLPANGKQKVEWKIYPQDAAYKKVVLFRLYVSPKYPYPSMSGKCGVVKINLPWLTGNQLMILGSGLALAAFAAGVVLVEKGIQPLDGISKTKTRFRINGIYFIATMLVVSGGMSYFGFWIVGIFGIAASILLTCAILLRS